MRRLKFEMWKHRDGGVMTRFTDGRGIYTDSWWSSPPSSINHVGPEYLLNRHPNVRNDRHVDFIKRCFKEEVVNFKEQTSEGYSRLKSAGGPIR
jgi:hypothetical protein